MLQQEKRGLNLKKEHSHETAYRMRWFHESNKYRAMKGGRERMVRQR